MCKCFKKNVLSFLSAIKIETLMQTAYNLFCIPQTSSESISNAKLTNSIANFRLN